MYIPDNMVSLEEKLEIELQSLESIRSTWDSIFEMILQIHKPFLDKNGLTPTTTPQQPWQKQGEKVYVIHDQSNKKIYVILIRT